MAGQDELQSAYLAMLANEIAPSRGLICRFDPDQA